MKKTGIQHAEIIAAISSIGHTQYIIIADAGNIKRIRAIIIAKGGRASKEKKVEDRLKADKVKRISEIKRSKRTVKGT
jgi:hypothetical protein